MKKIATILLIGTVLHLIVNDREVTVNGKKRITKSLNFTVGANIEVDGREVPSFLPVKSIGREAEDLYRLLLGAGSPDGNGVNVLIHGEYAEEHFHNAGGVSQTRQVIKMIRGETIGQDHEMVSDVKERPRMRYGKSGAVLGGNTTADAIFTAVTVEGGQVDLGELRLAMNSKKRIKANNERGYELVDNVEFINVKGWRGHAASVAGVVKGKPVLIEGHLRDDSFTNRDTQEYVQRLCVEVTMLYNRAPAPAPRRTQPARTATPSRAAPRQTPARQTPAAQPRFTAPGPRR